MSQPNILIIPTSENCDPATGKAKAFGLKVDALRISTRLDRLNKTTTIEQDGFQYLLIAASYADKTSVTIVLTTESHGFICKPRINNSNTGWTFGASELKELPDNKDIYPLRHTDKTSAAMIQDEDVSYSRTYEFQQYGNVDWKGKRTSAAEFPDNTPILTWKGPTGRTIPFDNTKPIEGLTEGDIEFDILAEPRWTCFGSDVYFGGEVLNTVPVSTRFDPITQTDRQADAAPKVLGCALYRETKKMIKSGDGEVLRQPFYYLVAYVNNHYDGITGFFDEIWYTEFDNKELYDGETNPFGWRRMTLVPDTGKTDTAVIAGRPTECFFFNQSGTACTQRSKEWRINWSATWSSSAALLPVATLTYDEIGTTNAQYSQNIQTSTYSIDYSGSNFMFSDYDGDIRITSKIEITGGCKSIGTGDSDITAVDIPLFYLAESGYINGVPAGWTDLNIDAPLVRAPIDRELISFEGLKTSQRHTKNRVTTFSSTKGISLDVNKRTRNYNYSNAQGVNRLPPWRWIGVANLFGIDYSPFFELSSYSGASMKESYQTVDAEIYYLDLRNDLIVYNEIRRDMTFEMTSPTMIPFKTTWEDVGLYPFIKEAVPIIHDEEFIIQYGSNREYVSRVIAEPHGYWNGIRVCMPVFATQMQPRPVGFTYDGVYYSNAEDVDWYWQYAHWQSDGDMYLFYPDWIKSVAARRDGTSTDNILDAAEAEIRYTNTINQGTPDGKYGASISLPINKLFRGSVAVGLSGDLFYSIADYNSSLVNPKIKNGFIRPATGFTATPEKFFEVDIELKNAIGGVDDGTSVRQVPNVFYPVAPIQTIPLSVSIEE